MMKNDSDAGLIHRFVSETLASNVSQNHSNVLKRSPGAASDDCPVAANLRQQIEVRKPVHAATRFA